MFDIKFELREEFQPSRVSTRDLGAALNVCQSNVVRQDSKALPDKEVPPALKALPDGDILFVRRAVIPFRRSEAFGVEFNWVPSGRHRVELLQNTANTKVGRVTHHTRFQIIIKHTKNRGST